ncbi:hypothetical protein EW145_g5475 [Phellinidium pouzarii]|uniref:Restriction endonuclease type IV Mrr domain-containing protein n=1 Tax=Phellinidium pouzarii TaxID=167371 RepID=A0A4S4L028_9AGAM|nr:hypothetical protein EW145_g5475 [Phellinidium pouzarii]
MSLRRIGGKDDGGIDLCGWWWLPPLSSSSSSLPSPSGMRDDLTVIATNEEGVTRRRVRVIAQCKAERKKLGPNYVREMEGVLHRHLHMPKDTDTQQLVVPTVALLVSESAFTKSTVLRALSSPLPFMLLHLPRVVSDASDVDSNGESDTGTLDSFGSAIWNPALGGQRGILAGDIDLRWELSGSVGGSRRPSLWWRGTRLESWVPPYER